jgi:hypothetical protein
MRKFPGAYSPYGSCIQIRVSILYDSKRSRPGRACAVCRVRRCGMCVRACVRVCVCVCVCVHIYIYLQKNPVITTSVYAIPRL